MSLVSFEVDNLDNVDSLFQDAIVYCNLAVMKLLIEMDKNPGDISGQHMLDFYYAKVEAYNNMTKALKIENNC